MRPVPRQRGFALATILWLLAGLTILIASVSTSLLAVARTNHDTQERLRLLLAEQRAVADVAYLTLTYKTLGTGVQVGAQVLQLDGSTRYTLEDGASVALQDMGGLVALNSPAGDDVRRLLGYCGASSEQADALSDALLDYADADSLKRINGAEAYEYSAANLTPPRNQPLMDARELWQVYGWKALRDTWRAKGCDSWVSLASHSQLNLWTAPAAALQAIGMSPEEARAAVAERDLNRDRQLLSQLLLQFRNQNEIGGLGGTRFSVRSRGQVRVTVMLAQTSVMRQFVLERGRFNMLMPFSRSQFAWLTKPEASAKDETTVGGYRFTDNLANYFLAQPGLPTPADAQVPLLPIGQR